MLRNKALITLAITIGVLAAVYKSDNELHSRQFMGSYNAELASIEVLPIQERELASVRGEPAIVKAPNLKTLKTKKTSSSSNSSIKRVSSVRTAINHSQCPVTSEQVNGKWQGQKYRYIVSGNVRDESPFKKEVQLILNGKCQVTVNNDKKHVFQVASLGKNGHLILQKKYRKGIEMLELSRNLKKEVGPTQRPVSESAEVQLVLDSAATGTNHYKDATVEGEMNISDASLNLSAVIAKGTKEEKRIQISDVEKNGNSFVFSTDSDEGEVVNVGIITTNGTKTAYSIRFSTGDFKGIVLNFVTAEEKENLVEISEVSAQERELASENIEGEEVPAASLSPAVRF